MTIKTLSLASLATLFGFGAGVVLFAPLDKALGLIKPEQRGVLVFAPEGRLLQGHVDRVQVQGQAVQDLHWRLRPLQLFFGQVSGQAQLKLAENVPVRSDFSLRPDGTLKLFDLRVNTNLAALKPLLKLPFLPLSAQARLDVREARIENGRPVMVDGQLDLSRTTWTLLKPAVTLGQYRVNISSDDQGVIAGQIQDEQALIGATGTLKLSQDGQYILDAKIRARPEAPAMMRNSLAAMGSPDSSGAYPLKYQGRVPGW